MKDSYTVDIVQRRGKSYDIGYHLGECIRGKKIIDIYKKKMHSTIDIANMEAVFSTYAPHLLEALHGLAEGVQISYEKACAIFSGYDIPKLDGMGCSAVVNKDYYVRNYDFTPLLYDHLFQVIGAEKTFASAGYSQQILGRLDGANNEGLVVGLHFVSFQEFQRGVSAWTAVRILLDTCSNTSEAVDLLKELPHAACYNFSIGDKSGNLAAVEASPKKVIVRKDPNYITCVNHFQDKEVAHKNRQHLAFSISRNDQIQYLSGQSLSTLEMFDQFRDDRSPLFFKNYDDYFGTLHSFAYSFQDAQITTCLAQSEHIVSFRLDDWVNGEEIQECKLQGNIEREKI